VKESSKRAGPGRRKAFPNDSVMKWLWLSLALIFLVGGNVARFLLNHLNMLHGYLDTILEPVSLAIAGYYCYFRSKKYQARIERESGVPHIMALDPRPPVVYLRSFDEDKKGDHPLHLNTDSQEEVLGAFFKEAGPFVAVGRPDEDFPTLGAARIYLDEDWQSQVVGLMSVARLVVLRTGQTENLLWELERATQMLRPEQLLLLVPSGRKEYEAFRARAESYFPRPLPEYPSRTPSRAGLRGFVCFEPDWTPRFLTFRNMFLRGSMLNPLPPALKATLRPVYERLGVPWRPPSINWVRVLVACFFAFALLYDVVT